MKNPMRGTDAERRAVLRISVIIAGMESDKKRESAWEECRWGQTEGDKVGYTYSSVDRATSDRPTNARKENIKAADVSPLLPNTRLFLSYCSWSMNKIHLFGPGNCCCQGRKFHCCQESLELWCRFDSVKETIAFIRPAWLITQT